MQTEVSTLIIEDEPMLAEWSLRWLEKTFRHVRGHIASDAEAALRIARDVRPELVLLDIGLPGADGLELVPPLRQVVPRARILVLSGQIEPFAVYRVLSADVNGFVDKPSSIDVLARAIRTVLAGGAFYSPAFTEVRREALDAPESFQKILSPREQHVLQSMASGCTDAEIAEQADISPHTVAVHRKSLRRKLDAHSDRELLAYALRWGIRPLSCRGRATPRKRPDA